MSNILHVVNIYFVIPYFLGNQIKHFRSKGFNIHIICSPSKDLIKNSKEQGFQYKEIPVLRKISLINDIKAIWKIIRYIKNNKIDIVNGHTPKGGLLSMIAGFVGGVKTRIYFRHGLVYETSSGLKRYMLISMDRLASLLATKIVCVSPSVYNRSIKDKLNPEWKQVVLSKGTCNGIDIKRFNKSNIDQNQVNELKIKLGINTNDFVIGFTGRLVRDKGIIELMEAFETIHQKYPGTKLLLVGMLEERDALPPATIERIKGNSSVIHTGYVDNKTIEQYYSLMNLFVLPSYREGFPTSVLEASSMELPIITTRVTGCIDSIVPDKTGVFVDHNASTIANAIIPFVEDNNLCEIFGSCGRKFVVDNFQEKIVWQEIEKLYQ